MAATQFDVLVIGAGPGGYIAALRAAQRGLRVACVDPHELLGGTCLRVGCIPSKALLESSELLWRLRHESAAHGILAGEVGFDLATLMERKQKIVTTLARGIESLFKKHGVTRLRGTARLTAGGVTVDGADAGSYAAERIVLAAGSVSAEVPGVAVDGQRIITSTEALDLSAPPGHLIVLGAGAIGLELGSVWLRLGARVTVVELLERILPTVDLEAARSAQRLFEKQGMVFQLGRRVVSARPHDDGVEVECAQGELLRGDRLLVAVGRRACSASLGLAAAGVACDARGRVEVGPGYATSVPGVFAIGDLIAGPMLAHRAEMDAVACVDGWFGEGGAVDYALVPAVVYTEPELASVGESEESLVAAGRGYHKGIAFFRPNGRARAMERTDGLAKVLAGDDGRLLGVHIVGPYAGELIAEATVALRAGLTAAELAHCAHAHPTLAEVLRDAARAAAG